MKRGRAIDEERVVIFGDGQFRNLHFIFCYPCCVTSASDFQEEAVAVKIQALGDCRRSTAITPCVVSILFISFKANVTSQVVRDPRPRGFENHLQRMVRCFL